LRGPQSDTRGIELQFVNFGFGWPTEMLSSGGLFWQLGGYHLNMTFLLAYLAGLLTLINPCVLPILPIVLASSVQSDRRGPVALAAGLSLSFVLVGLLVIVLGAAVGIDQRTVTLAGAWLMLAFAAVLLIPRLNQGFATVTAGLAGRANLGMHALDKEGRSSGLVGQFLGGLLLGAVWSPCIGPTLGGAISLASQGQNLIASTAIMIAFALGVSSIIIALGFGAREAIQRRQNLLRGLQGRARIILGITFLCVGLTLLTGLDHWLEGRLLDMLPTWLQDFSVSI
jgi:cytochrome c-type biogenesis protein